LSIALSVSAPKAGAAGLDTSLYAASGTVYDIAVDGPTVYIAGDFTGLGTDTGTGAGLDPVTGGMVDGFPGVIGTIHSVIPDGQDPSGWYIAGSITHVDEVLRPGIAHILPDKTLDPLFNPLPFALFSGAIRAMVLDGDILYIGGPFVISQGTGTYGLAAINTAASAIDDTWRPNPIDGASTGGINAMALSGSTLYVAGNFTSIGGQDRSGLAAVVTLAGDPADAGTADPFWDPNPGDGTVLAMAPSDGHLYVGGTFTAIGGQTRSRIAAIEASGTGDGTGKADASWNPDVTGESVNTLLLSGSRLYVAGAFTSIGGQARNSVAVTDGIDAGDGTGRADSLWDPDIASVSVWSMVLDEANARLFVGGDFSEVGGIPRSHIAVVDAMGRGDGTGAVDGGWYPDADRPVFALALSRDASILYAGGLFSTLFTVKRSRIAALDKATGAPTSWNPGADGRVRSLVLSGTTLYAGGRFAAIGGEARSRLAALDTTVDTDNATDWNPGADADILDMVISDTTIYVAGDFTQIGGEARNGIAALSTVSDTNSVSDWNPDADGSVHSLLLDGTTLYVGGAFTQIGGEARERLAALDTTVDVGNATDWDPGVTFSNGGESAVNALALYETTLYAGGDFDRIGDAERNNIAAIDTGTVAADPTPWDPDLDDTVNAMYLSGSNLYVAGAFSFAGGDGISDEDDPGGIDQGIVHNGVVVLDIARDSLPVRAWNPLFVKSGGAEVFAVVRDGLDLYAGGSFDSVLLTDRSNLVRTSLTPPTLTVDLAEGTYPKAQFASITCEPAEGFECELGYYTLDGSEPTHRSTPIISGGVYIESSATLRFFVIDSAGAESDMVTRSYVIESEDVICFIGGVLDGRLLDGLPGSLSGILDDLIPDAYRRQKHRW